MNTATSCNDDCQRVSVASAQPTAAGRRLPFNLAAPAACGSLAYACERLRCYAHDSQIFTQFTKKKSSKKRKERPMTAIFFSSNNNANGKEKGHRNYNGTSTSFRLILGLENAV